MTPVTPKQDLLQWYLCLSAEKPVLTLLENPAGTKARVGLKHNSLPGLMSHLCFCLFKESTLGEKS